MPSRNTLLHLLTVLVQESIDFFVTNLLCDSLSRSLEGVRWWPVYCYKTPQTSNLVEITLVDSHTTDMMFERNFKITFNWPYRMKWIRKHLNVDCLLIISLWDNRSFSLLCGIVLLLQQIFTFILKLLLMMLFICSTVSCPWILDQLNQT